MTIEFPTDDEALNWDNYESANVADLIGKTLVCAIQNGNTSINFADTDGGRWQMRYQPDCCASCSIEDVVGDLADLVGAPIVMAEESHNNDDADGPKGGEFPDESFTLTFYKFATVKGYVTIRWYGSSNGYYSESASFVRLK